MANGQNLQQLHSLLLPIRPSSLPSRKLTVIYLAEALSKSMGRWHFPGAVLSPRKQAVESLRPVSLVLGELV